MDAMCGDSLPCSMLPLTPTLSPPRGEGVPLTSHQALRAARRERQSLLPPNGPCDASRKTESRLLSMGLATLQKDGVPLTLDGSCDASRKTESPLTLDGPCEGRAESESPCHLSVGDRRRSWPRFRP